MEILIVLAILALLSVISFNTLPLFNKAIELESFVSDTTSLLTRAQIQTLSSKDEKRRLVASVHLGSQFNCEYIGFGNKTNYIGITDSKLPIEEAYGLAAIFNSSFMV